MRHIILAVILCAPSAVLAQDISSPDFFSSSTPNYSFHMPAPLPPPVIDLTPTYAYQNNDPARSITILPSRDLKPTYLYPGRNPGDPITVISPNGSISYIYPGRSR